MFNTKILKNKYLILFLIYTAILVFFAVFSYKLIFHDAWEYILLAKKFSGYLNSSSFSVHSLVYPYFISFFTKIFPSILTIRLVNISWIILTGLLLYYSGFKKTSFLIWIFSPIAWIYTIFISPAVPATFFLLLAYLTIKKWRENKKISYFVISALSLGLSVAFYDFALILAVFFIFAFFYDKKFKEVIFYSLFTLLSFSTRLILDASFFSLAVKDKLIPFPFYSLIRFWGATLIIQLGLHPQIPTSKILSFSFSYLLPFIIISPLLFYLIKTDYKENKNVIIFLILSSVFIFLSKGGEYFYFLPLAPIAILLLSKTFKKKALITHILVSCIITLIFVTPYFIPDEQEIEKRNIIISDLKDINNEFSFKEVVFDTDTLAIFYIWDKKLPYIIPSEEVNKILQNDTYYTYYTFEIKPKIDTQKILEFKTGMKVNVKEGINYENLPWIIENGKNVPSDYKLTKCYKLLCVYEKI